MEERENGGEREFDWGEWRGMRGKTEERENKGERESEWFWDGRERE
jgi:hypothetical protein